ncbi:glutamate racemase [Reinekea marina]|uniref:Glutamate racemase n=2 Tax=Reinekea marina TaxID=1310421 RepID=A0ABV7WS74_9GAMM
MIGVFDSGIGGLTVLSSIYKLMPESPLIYVADQAHAPYGNLSDALLLKRCRLITSWLEAQGCTLVVIACNTATAMAIDTLRKEFTVPIVGVEPGIKPAAISSQSRCVGILATENTVASGRYKRLLERFMPSVSIASQGCPGLADAIEQGSHSIDSLLQQYSKPLLQAGADQIVLGCTHYPLVMQRLQKIVGNEINIIDTSDAVALEVQRRYNANSSQNGLPTSHIALFTTGSQTAINRIVATYAELTWLADLPVQHCALSDLAEQP